MKNKQPPFQITNKIIDDVAEISVLTEDLHLKIIDYEQDSELNDIISEYYDALSEYIRSHNYSGFFQTRLFI